MSLLATKTNEKLDLANEAERRLPTLSDQERAQAGLGPLTTSETDVRSRARQSDSAMFSQAGPKRPSNAKVKSDDLILFTTQLSVMLDAGVVLSDALDAIGEQADREGFKIVILSLADAVKNGENFSKVLAEYPRIFNPMFISMVKASEASGRMPEMLNVLSGYLSFETETRKRIKGALTYPFIMALMAVAATGTLMFFVLPRFMRIYEAKGAALPKLTQVLVGFSKILGNFQAMTGIVTTLIVTLMALYYHVYRHGCNAKYANYGHNG